ncbi:hypothetical protein M1O52_00090 [Dehalococcoidia bacterium]|nr:hypothetical protein [Dehalococcoidia bacterium]
MGFVYTKVMIHGKKASRSMEMLVGTGSTYIVLDPRSIKQLGLSETGYRVKLTSANKSEAEAELFWAEVEAKGRRGLAFLAQLEVPRPLLGVYALETLGFKVNPETGELEEVAPEGGFLLGKASKFITLLTLAGQRRLNF